MYTRKTKIKLPRARLHSGRARWAMEGGLQKPASERRWSNFKRPSLYSRCQILALTVVYDVLYSLDSGVKFVNQQEGQVDLQLLLYTCVNI